MTKPTRLILFGGAEVGQAAEELKMIGKIMNEMKPRQVFHVPFARTSTSEPEWSGDWFHRNIKLSEGIEYLNAERSEDMDLVLDDPLVFLSGGSNNKNLLDMILQDDRLLRIISSASLIIGESAGAKVLGEYFRLKGADNDSPMIKGLGIIADVVIEPHYTERNRQELLLKDMAETGVRYGLGIDTVTAIDFINGQFPEKFTKIGSGKIVVKVND